jgi:hypothetical protein
METTLDPRHTLGRIFGTDWTIANVAKLLRANAAQGILRAGPLTGGMREINQDYLRRTSARHLPSNVVATFRRDDHHAWHAELCFAGLQNYLPWNDAVAEEWLAALFLECRPLVCECPSDSPVTRHFTLAV